MCAAKKFTQDLKRHDLREFPLPYEKSAFNHVISVAVLNSFEKLDVLFQEVARLIKNNGIFAFTTESPSYDNDGSYSINRTDVDHEARPEAAVTLFRHSDEYIYRKLVQNEFELLKSQKFAAFKYPAENRDVFFTAHIARKLD